MVRSYPQNRNLNVITDNTYQGLGLSQNQSYFQQYLDDIIRVMNESLTQHAGVMVVRFDLHFKSSNVYGEHNHYDSAVITKFFQSLKAKIDYHYSKRKGDGLRAYPYYNFNVWAKEQDTSVYPHYHVALLIDRQTFSGLGPYGDQHQLLEVPRPYKCLSQMIIEAWASAIGESLVQAYGLVHFSSGGSLVMTRGDRSSYLKVFQKLSYLAKVKTKQFGDGTRSFGSNNAKRGLQVA